MPVSGLYAIDAYDGIYFPTTSRPHIVDKYPLVIINYS